MSRGNAKREEKLEQHPSMHVLAGMQLCLLLVYDSAVVKVGSLNLRYLKTRKDDCLYKEKCKSEIGTLWLFVEIAPHKWLNGSQKTSATVKHKHFLKQPITT